MNQSIKSLKQLPNIGEKIALRLVKIDIHSKEEFLAKDPYEVFNQLLEKEPTLCRCALASIVGANLEIPWHRITKETAKEFDKRFPQHIWKNKC